MSLPSINFLHLPVSEIQPGQTFSRCPPDRHPDNMGENNTPTALKGCGVKSFIISSHLGYFSNVLILPSIICVGKQSDSCKISSLYFSKTLSIQRYQAYRPIPNYNTHKSCTATNKSIFNASTLT